MKPTRDGSWLLRRWVKPLLFSGVMKYQLPMLFANRSSSQRIEALDEMVLLLCRHLGNKDGLWSHIPSQNDESLKIAYKLLE